MRAQSALAGAAVPLAILWLAASTAGPAAAQLTSFRAQLFTESDLLFYGPASDDEFGYALAAGDFDGDGADDLATGIPWDDNMGGLYPDTGVVVVRYGVPGSGLAGGLADDVLSQFTGGSPDPPEEWDAFGAALASGDFDGDGFADLVVGAFGEDDSAGGIQVHYGSAAGLALIGAQFFDQDSPGISDLNEDWDHFGEALAVADFDGDGFADAAVGVPGEDALFPDNWVDYGRLVTLYGSPSGLGTARSQSFDQNTPGVPDFNESEDGFASALAACDFDADGHGDLAIGIHAENVYTGSVCVLYGSASGLAATGAQGWAQGTNGVPGEPEEYEHFGHALACGDFDADGFADLAIGAIGEAPPGQALTGAVFVLYGTAAGLSANGAQTWTQDSPGIQEIGESWDYFGWSLAAGDFVNDGAEDLVIGARGEDIGAGPFDGAVHVLAGRSDFGGLVALGNQLWHQESPGVPGNGEQGDEFGRALAVGDFDASGHQDLAIGGPRESTDGLHGNGAEWVLYGSLFADGFESGSAGRWSSVVP